ncbi:hypothetical protein [Nostoc sp. C052]|uniref:hypothetical protein n=1 Tax=Nostoc sp. C052 TaxID=2576902 RepID=UPI002117B7AD|nr:hypothetical protein [Nostoc sp. C052]
MMLNIEGVLKQDRLLRALTRLNRKAFDALLPTFTTMYLETQQTKPRQRALGGGRKARLQKVQDKYRKMVETYLNVLPFFFS